MAGNGPKKETVQKVADRLFALLQAHPGGPSIRWDEEGSWKAAYNKKEDAITYVLTVRNASMLAVDVPMCCFIYDTPTRIKEAVYEQIIEDLVAWLLITKHVPSRRAELSDFTYGDP